MKTLLFFVGILFCVSCSQEAEKNKKDPLQEGSDLLIQAESETEAGQEFDFGTQLTRTYKKVTFILNNNNIFEAKVLKISSSNSSFQVGSSTCTDIAGLSKCTLAVTYSPSTSGSFLSELTVSYQRNGITNSSRKILRGTGKERANLVFSPGTLDFGELGLPADQTLTTLLQNIGGTAATSLAFSAVGTPFQIVSSNCGSSLSVNESCTLQLKFQSDTVSSTSKTLNVSYQDGAESQVASAKVKAITTNGSFNSAKGFDGTIMSIETGQNGALLIGGSFTSFSSTRSGHLIKLKSDLSVESMPFTTGFDGDVYAIQPLADGKFYVGGNFSTYNGTSVSKLVRLNSDGNLDTSFNAMVSLNAAVRALALDANQKLIVAGEFSSLLARLNTDGSIDSGFTMGTGFVGSGIYALGFDSQGFLLAGGNFSSYNGDAAANLIRIKTDGTRDASFDTTTASNGTVYAILMESNDGMYLGGDFTSYKGASANRIIRLTSNGNKEPLFNYGTGFNATVRTLAAANSDIDQLYVGGEFSRYQGTTLNSLAKLDSMGNVDTSFVAGNGPNGTVYTVKKLSDDSVLVGGNFQAYKEKGVNRLVRISSVGSLLPSFSESVGASQKVLALSSNANGTLLVAGNFSRYADGSYSNFLQVDRHGSVDNSLNAGTGFNAQVNALVPSPFGADTYLIAGQFTQYQGNSSNRIVAVNASGSVNTQFAVGTGFNGSVNALLASSSALYAGGQFTSYQGQNAFGIIRLTANGNSDPTFVKGSGFNGTVWALAEDSSHRLYVAGDFTSYQGTAVKNIARLLSDGSLDTSFQTGTGFDLPVWTLAVDTNGNVYAGGDFTTYNGSGSNGLIKLKAEGTIDTSFNIGSGFNSGVNAVVLTNNGSLYLTGSFTEYQGATANYIVELDSQGNRVSTFSSGTGFNGQGYVLKIAADGSDDLYVGGTFTSYNGITTDSLVRLSQSGSLE